MTGLRRDFDDDEAALQAAAMAATKTLGLFTAILWLGIMMLVFLDPRWEFPHLVIAIWVSIWLAIMIAPFIVFFGVCIGWMTLRMFGESSVSLIYAAEAIALLFFFSIVGWGLVIICG
jgi:hypothetical protein